MKLVEYMATPIPIVAVDHPSITGLIGKHTVHLSLADGKKFAETILTAVRENQNQKQQRKKNQNLVAQQYDHAERARMYDNWLNEIIAVTKSKKQSN
jgi:hypothetical protein